MRHADHEIGICHISKNYWSNLDQIHGVSYVYEKKVTCDTISNFCDRYHGNVCLTTGIAGRAEMGEPRTTVQT